MKTSQNMGIFPDLLNLKQLFLKLNQFIYDGIFLEPLHIYQLNLDVKLE